MTKTIKRITPEQLDKILLPLIATGELHTRYNHGTTATEYRDATGRILAVSVGQHSFAEAC